MGCKKYQNLPARFLEYPLNTCEDYTGDAGMKDTISHAYCTSGGIGSRCRSHFFSLHVSSPLMLVPAVVLLGLAVFLAGYSRHRLFSIILIGLFTALILSLRFDYLTWGDPWSEYGMIQGIIAYHSLDPSVYPLNFRLCMSSSRQFHFFRDQST